MTATPDAGDPPLSPHAGDDPDSPSPATAEVIGTGALRWKVERALHSFARAQADLMLLLAPFDISGDWSRDGADSCAAWLSSRHGIARSTARDWLRVSHELARCQVAADAFRNGQLSYSAARSVTRVTTMHPERAEELVEIGVRTAVNDLPRTLARWVQDNETVDQQNERHERETRLSVRTEADGMSVMTLVLPPVLMAEVMSVVDGEVHKGHGFDNRTSVGRRRTLAGQRARCLHRLLTSGRGSPIAREVLIHVRADGCTMHDGTPISDHAVASIVGESFVRALIHDIDGRPIDATFRRRHPTTRQQRVVDERHGNRCSVCGGADLIDYDHVPPFSESHRTIVDELDPKCRMCHRVRHSRDGD